MKPVHAYFSKLGHFEEGFSDMKQHNKRWLMSKMRSSGSRRLYLYNGTYSDDRHAKRSDDLEHLPAREKIKSTYKGWNGKINYGPLIRFLRHQVGNDWDEVYSEYIQRIPSKLMDYKSRISWFVADKVIWHEGRLYNAENQKFLHDGNCGCPCTNDHSMFYVHPDTRTLCRSIPRKFHQSATEGLEKEDLRKFREAEANSKRKERNDKKLSEKAQEETSREILSAGNRKKRESRQTDRLDH